jgi:hypothetical protein
LASLPLGVRRRCVVDDVRMSGWQRVAVVVLRVMAVFCLVCVVLGLAWGFWLNAVLSGLGGVAFWVWASEVRDGRAES